jgi:hypothetical protein
LIKFWFWIYRPCYRHGNILMKELKSLQNVIEIIFKSTYNDDSNFLCARMLTQWDERCPLYRFHLWISIKLDCTSSSFWNHCGLQGSALKPKQNSHRNFFCIFSISCHEITYTYPPNLVPLNQSLCHSWSHWDIPNSIPLVRVRV